MLCFYDGSAINSGDVVPSVLVEKVAAVRPASSKISSLIQEAETKAVSAKKKPSLENLNLLKRESPLGGEDTTTKSSDDLANAPKLPPKPGKLLLKSKYAACRPRIPFCKAFLFPIIFFKTFKFLL